MNVNAMILIAARGFRVYALVIIDLCFSVWLIIYLSQSAAMPPLAAPAQIWMLTNVNMNILASAAAAASVQIHLGAASLVSSIQQLEPDSGSR